MDADLRLLERELAKEPDFTQRICYVRKLADYGRDDQVQGQLELLKAESEVFLSYDQRMDYANLLLSCGQQEDADEQKVKAVKAHFFAPIQPIKELIIKEAGDGSLFGDIECFHVRDFYRDLGRSNNVSRDNFFYTKALRVSGSFVLPKLGLYVIPKRDVVSCIPGRTSRVECYSWDSKYESPFEYMRCGALALERILALKRESNK